MKQFSGASVAAGIVTGQALVCPEESRDIRRRSISEDQAPGELRRFLQAVDEAAEELRILGAQAAQTGGTSKELGAICAAHLEMLEDPDFHYQIKARLESRYENIEWVVYEVARDLSRKLMETPDAYLRERAADVADVSRRIIDRLTGNRRLSLADLDRDVILAVRNMLPSEVLGMNKDRVKAVVMDAGSRTSHTAILLRSFGVPSVLGLESAVREMTSGDTLIVDGASSLVILDPDEATLALYRDKAAGQTKTRQTAGTLRELPPETADGRVVRLMANIGIGSGAEEAERYGAEGIGLFRSEFLFLQGRRGSEEEQVEAYSAVIKAMKGKPVTIRTVDVGGDKVLPGMQLNEENPLLGWRAIRLSLSMPDLFKTQLRAILRASVHGPVRVLFPMISGSEEWAAALALLEAAREECRKKGQPLADRIETGPMIEVPAAAMIAGALAEKADFFSIGTNDLVQYTLAADRGNSRVRFLAQPFHPAVLRLIRQSIDAAHSRRIPAALCGELAGEPSAAALLLGLGLDEFSMAAESIPRIKRIIRSVTYADCQALAEEVLAVSSGTQICEILKRWHREHLGGEAIDGL